MKQYLENRIAELEGRGTEVQQKIMEEFDIDKACQLQTELDEISGALNELMDALEHYNQQQLLSSGAEKFASDYGDEHGEYSENADGSGCSNTSGIITEAVLVGMRWTNEHQKPVPVSSDVEALAEQYAKQQYIDAGIEEAGCQHDKSAFIAGYQARVAQEGITLSEKEINQMVEEKYPLKNNENSVWARKMYRDAIINVQNKLRGGNNETK